ncbi:MAG: 4-hydroxy-tetrahydrodipicolinate reductase [Mediterranea sp.]|jgi:4-hydroxy-tetrahydrodipicolinate reductase|nr:4-hydroxy-tetrahydrodipicolinate reductase [Mediterranea sp.]
MKIALIGYGKMGKEIEQIAIARGHQIVSIIDINNPEEFQSEAFKSADVAIEFTNPDVAYDNCVKAFEAGVKVVSGSTGWIDKHTHDLAVFCEEKGKTLFWSSNFSLGVAIFSAVNKYLAQLMENFPNYDVSMEEIHHTQKKDAPSGTAITLAEGILENLTRKDKWVKEHASTPDELAIHSIREGNVPGTHTISYASDADSIIITHKANNRSGFSLGAVLAAEYTVGHSGRLSMNDLFPFLK